MSQNFDQQQLNDSEDDYDYATELKNTKDEYSGPYKHVYEQNLKKIVQTKMNPHLFEFIESLEYKYSVFFKIYNLQKLFF